LHVQDIVLERLMAGMDPKNRARDYIESAIFLLREAEKGINEKNPRQASEKIWEAAALTIKAHTYWKRENVFQVIVTYGSIKRKSLGSLGNGSGTRGMRLLICTLTSTRTGRERRMSETPITRC